MDTIAAKSNYDGVTTPAPANEVHEASEFNDRNVELQNAVTDTGHALDAADPRQLSKSLFANGVGAQSMLDSGAVNTVVLTPITGASGLRLAVPVAADYSLLEGAIFNFQAGNTNTGNVTVNIGQTVGTLIGAQPLFLPDGSTEIPVGLIESGTYYSIRYDSSLDVDGAFVLIDSSIAVVGDSDSDTDSPVTFPYNLRLAFGEETVGATTSSNVSHGLSKCFTAWAVIKSSAGTTRNAPQIENIGDSTFDLFNTNGASLTYKWFALGR